MASKLFLVGTPIGNLGDMSQRAVDTLRAVDFIAAEDTRVSRGLLAHFDIHKPLVSYYEHNLRERGAEIVGRILNGESCAVITDAGMPCVSDPGEDLVKLCAESGIETIVVPGPSAVVSALAVSGLATGRFAFEGFLSVKKSSRAEHLESVKNDTRTIIFYEAPHKLLRTIRDMLDILGDRRVTLARELTKFYEEVRRTTLSEAVAYYEENPPRGEFVIVLEGAAPKSTEPVPFEAAVEIARQKLNGGMPVSQAAREASRETGHKKADLYKALHGDAK